MNLQNAMIAKDLDTAAEKEKEVGIGDIIKEQLSSLNLKGKADGDRITALEKSISTLVNFIDRGGEIDFIVPEKDINLEKKSDDVFAKIREQTQEIREIEVHLKRIEKNKNQD